ncbi:MAG: TetR/AcrR family transcriptional regulator [Erythrobacter sp.]
MGRKKLYERSEALKAIKLCFWKSGFEGTSIQDLERCTGLPKQTLYREFSDKEGMYLAALADYEQTEIRESARILSQHDDPKEAFAALFAAAIAPVDTDNERRGCFLCNAAADMTGIESAIATRVEEAIDRLISVFEQSLSKRQSAKDDACMMLAGYVGLRVLSRGGMGSRGLNQVANQLVAAL